MYARKSAGKSEPSPKNMLKKAPGVIGVVGGGIAGAAAALALQQKGFRVILMERDTHFNQRK
jgi:heterodisulfide reductase subunit A-like polyferredoxin